MQRSHRIAMGSVLVGIIVLALKALAYHLTGSLALFSDAMESTVNVASALATYLALRYSARPADDNHPYGHNKVEYFAAVLIGALVLLAAVTILIEAIPALLAPQGFAADPKGLAVNAASGVVNAGWCAIIWRQGKASRSPALLADARHLAVDVLTSLGVLAGIILAATTGLAVLDPLLATLVAVGVLWSGWVLLGESVGGLMDVAVPPKELARIRDIISDHAAGAIEAHDLRTRHAGAMTFIDFHLVVPGAMSVTEAHSICDRLEAALRAEIGQSVITIHVEPEEKKKHSGIVVV